MNKIYLCDASRFFMSISLVGEYFGKLEGSQAYGIVLKYWKKNILKKNVKGKEKSITECIFQILTKKNWKCRRNILNLCELKEGDEKEESFSPYSPTLQSETSRAC